ncbi:MAG: serine protease [Proteobacteria bacterium]|nr:serine protease [Pseudomonadota bacterium]
MPAVTVEAPQGEAISQAVGLTNAFAERKKLLKALEKARKSKVILYVTGDRPGWQTQISSDVPDMFIDHLDLMGSVKRISLVLYTSGGDTLAAWNLVNLLRQFCDELEIILPAKALSAGTLMSLGANRIIMTKQATLGPIDPSVTGPLNPIIPGAPINARAPVSVEAIRGYLDFATKDLGIKETANIAQIFTFLSQQVHPLVLGQIFRTRTQIQYLARRFLAHQVSDQEKVDRIIAFLCSESGSHDYTINRREARELGLVVETPSEDLYVLLRQIHLSFRAELQLNEPFDPNSLIGNNAGASYHFKRCLIESVAGGSHAFVSEGTLSRMMVPGPNGLPQPQNTDQRTFEGWKKLA